MVRAWGTVGSNGLHVDDGDRGPGAVYMAAAFKEALRSRGILVSGTAVSRHKVSNGTGDFAGERAQPLQLTRSDLARVIAPVAERKVLAMHFSVPVAEDITVTNKTSQNLHAELLLRLLGKVFGIGGQLRTGNARGAAVSGECRRGRQRLFPLRRLGNEPRRPDCSARLYAAADLRIEAAVGRAVARDAAGGGRGRHPGERGSRIRR